MKLRHTITSLVSPLLSLAIAISASSMAVAQNGATTTTPGQGDRPANTVPSNQSPQVEAAQQHREDPQDARRANEQQPRDTANNVRTDTDCIDLDTNAAGNANAQRAPETIAQTMPDRDDCLDLIRNGNGNANENRQGGEPANTADGRAGDNDD